MSMISDKRMFRAFLKGKLGTAEIYPLWTPIWAVRSGIWRGKGDRRQAVLSLGEMTREAIEEGNSTLLRQWAKALDWMKRFERKPVNALRADVYYAIEELNGSRPSFTREDVLAMLNGDLQTGVTAKVLDRELERFGLEGKIPRARRKNGGQGAS